MIRLRVRGPARVPSAQHGGHGAGLSPPAGVGALHELVLMVYGSTSRVPDRRFPLLVSQLRRASSSIPSNIAEGCGHDTQKELARFLQIALASAHELHYHLRLAHDLDVLPATAYAKLDARTEQVKQMLSGLLRKVRGQPRRLEPRAGAVVT